VLSKLYNENYDDGQPTLPKLKKLLLDESIMKDIIPKNDPYYQLMLQKQKDNIISLKK